MSTFHNRADQVRRYAEAQRMFARNPRISVESVATYLKEADRADKLAASYAAGIDPYEASSELARREHQVLA